MIGTKVILLAFVLALSSCSSEELVYSKGDIKLEIEVGEHWLHDFPLIFGLSKKNAPQFAVWLEDTDGNYLSTVFVTSKIATEGWMSNGGNRRKEALPHWCFQRGVTYDDGLMLPTKENPLPDGITGATPKENKIIKMTLASFDQPVVVKVELNHSLDFNEFYTKEALEGAVNYSGGKMGSGQPAVVYAATIIPSTQTIELQLIGHSCADGSNGDIYTNMDSLTTAKTIVKRIRVTLE